MMAKKVVKKAVKKATAKKTVTKKSVTLKTAALKTVAKKAAPKKVVAKKVVAKKKVSSKLPDNKHKVQFKLYAPDATEVYLTGEFNKWSPVKKVMRKNATGEWVTRIILPEGDHQYKFIVDGDWVNDPGASKFVDNGMGGSNSVRVV